MFCSMFSYILDKIKARLKKKSWSARWGTHPVNLEVLETGRNSKMCPIFTRDRLQQCRLVRDKIINDKEFPEYSEQDLTGEMRAVWKR
jgi:hypothetical protein